MVMVSNFSVNDSHLVVFESVNYLFNTTKGEVNIAVNDAYVNIHLLINSISILIDSFNYSNLNSKLINSDLFCYMFKYQIALDEIKNNHSGIKNFNEICCLQESFSSLFIVLLKTYKYASFFIKDCIIGFNLIQELFKSKYVLDENVMRLLVLSIIEKDEYSYNDYLFTYLLNNNWI